MHEENLKGRTFHLGYWLIWLFLAVVVVLSQTGLIVERSGHDLTIAIPYLMAHGLRLYDDIYSYHPPLILWVLSALYRIFDPLTTLRVLNVTFIFATGLAIYWAVRKCLGWHHALVAAAFYYLWAVNYNGLLFYLDGIIGSLSVLIFLVLVDRRVSWLQLIVVGLLAGIAAALKPSAIAIPIVPVLWIVWNERGDTSGARWRHVAIVLLTSLLVFFGQYGIIILNGNWSLAASALFNPGNAAWLFDFSNSFDGNAWRTVALTIVCIPAFFLLWLRDIERFNLGILLWLLLGVTAVLNFPVPGYYHFMSSLPIIAIMSGIVIGEGWVKTAAFMPITGIRDLLNNSSFAGLTLSGLLVGVMLAALVTIFTPAFLALRQPVLTVGWDELKPVSQWLAENTRENETVLVLPTYDTNGDVYALSNRFPPFYFKTWFYHAQFPENARLFQGKIVSKKPDVIVFFPDLYLAVSQYFPELNSLMKNEYHSVGHIDNVPFQGHVIFLRHQIPSS